MATSEPPPPPPPPPPSTTPQRWKRELRVMLRIALPIVATNLLGVTMTLVDFAMVGRLGKEELGGAALGNTVFYLLHFPMLGLLTALDTLLAAAFGAGNFEAYGAWTQTASAVVSALSIPVSVFLGVATTPLLLAIGQDATLSKLAGRYCAHLTWGLLPYYLFIVAMKFMQTQRVLAPPVWIAVIANVVNVGLNYALIYAADLGFDGAPIATSASRWFQFIAGMTYLLSRPASTAKTRPRSFIGWRRLRRSVVAFASLAGPGLAMLMIEAWTFEITTIMAGYLGTVALDAHLTMLQLATFSFLSLPFAVAAAATIRIGAALGGGAFYVTLVPIRPRWRGERRSLRTFPGASLHPGSLAFNPRPRRLSTPTDAFELHPDVR
jgi:multidrug resistance protein, MATE family